jgi:hypothetical protein
LHKAGKESFRRGSHTLFTAIAVACLAAIFLSGLTICILYLSGTGRTTWFITLLLLMLSVVVCPALLLTKRRNLTLLVASLYLPLGIWLFLWSLAPNVHWEYGRTTAFAALCFLAIGALTMFLFLRDLRELPRL